MKRKYLFIVLGVILALGVAWTLYRIHEQRVEAVREEEAHEQVMTYIRLYYALGREGIHPDRFYIWSSSTIINWTFSAVYRPVEEWAHWASSSYGIDLDTYVVLLMYYHRTGIYLSYDVVLDYLSEEFEPDGMLRLYNNGNHPEIEAFVTWMVEGERRDELGDYWREISDMYRNYAFAHEDGGFERLSLNQLSPQIFDALARAEADPDYELDLTSLQEQDY